MPENEYSDTETDRDLDWYRGFVTQNEQSVQAEDASDDLPRDLVEAARRELAALTREVDQLITEFTTDDAGHVATEDDNEQIAMPTRSVSTGGLLRVRHADGAVERLTPTSECVQTFRDQETKLGKVAERMLHLVRACRLTHDGTVKYLTSGSGASDLTDPDDKVRKEAIAWFEFAMASQEKLNAVEKGVMDWKLNYRRLHAMSGEDWRYSVELLDSHFNYLKNQEMSVDDPTVIKLIDEFSTLLQQSAMPFHRKEGGTSEQCQAFFKLVDSEQ